MSIFEFEEDQNHEELLKILRVDQAKRLKILEKENGRLKKLVAEKELDISILKEVASGNF